MSDDLTVQNSALAGLDSSYTSTSETKAVTEAEETKNEFLTLLVTQLKNQDPLNPMENEDFAVDLAQFSQLEQLVEINNKTTEGAAAGSDVSSMAAYLGHEVLLNLSSINVEDGYGGTIDVELDSDATNVKVELKDSDGNVVESLDSGALEQGKHRLSLMGLNAMDGEYEISVSALGENGITTSPVVEFGGTVTGFVPGPEPVLIVDGREVNPADIREVRMASGSGNV